MLGTFVGFKCSVGSKSFLTERAAVCESVWEMFWLHVDEEVGFVGTSLVANATAVESSTLPDQVLLKRFQQMNRLGRT